ncbi:hypothetical protein WBJ53_21875 [Spirosoma sp. SC4-14]|uniref:hypothetical protein n=1 Tax=Spirosoma sp. SC4-14 TaxID=3128900 RepID=UPI0030CB8611
MALLLGVMAGFLVAFGLIAVFRAIPIAYELLGWEIIRPGDTLLVSDSSRLYSAPAVVDGQYPDRIGRSYGY